jgi:hypothetical protein
MAKKELKDYSGPFVHHVAYTDFSKEMLARLLKAYAKLYVLIDGLWLTKARQELGEEKAMAWDHEIWEKIVTQFEARWISEAAGIKGNSPVNIAKTFQMLPDGVSTQSVYFGEFTIEEDGNRVTFDVTSCPSLFYHERHGLDKVIGDGTSGNVSGACGIGGLEDVCMNAYAHYFNPEMEVRILKLPPRKSKDDICCTWEFTIPPAKPSDTSYVSPYWGSGKKAKSKAKPQAKSKK